MNPTCIYWLHGLSPTHVGSGRGLGYIDLPLMRDKVSNWPLIPGSAFKGVWADHYGASQEARKEKAELALAFGRASDQDANASNAGALILGDARLVALPIRSYFGTFAWCSSPLSLSYLSRDLQLAGIPLPPPLPDCKDRVLVSDDSKLLSKEKIYLEDLDFQAEESQACSAWAVSLGSWIFTESKDESWRQHFIDRFAIVPDSVFDYLSEVGTEVATRVHIDDETKTVKQGQLWTEELLPAETILAGLVSCDRVYAKDKPMSGEDLLKNFATDPLLLQVGGKASVGRGRMRCIFTHAKEEK